MSRLILLRHGQTEGNLAKRLDTALPGAPLTDTGIQQAKAAGQRLAGTAGLVLVSSKALRAKQTASYIEAATGVAVEALDGLHEAQAGRLENRSDEASHDLFKKVFHAWHLGDLSARTEDGESGDEVLSRYLPVVEQLRRKYIDNGEIVVVVSHGAAIRLVGHYLTDVPSLFAANNHLDNTETIELDPVGDGRWECVRWGKFEPPFEDDTAPVPDDPMG